LLSSLPLVSICIPAHNSEKFVGQTINCLLNQTWQNLEIVVVDDGSTDQTSQVLGQIYDSRVKYFRQTNKGAAAARNEAFNQSSGDFIKFMDADDLLNAQCIEKQLLKINKLPDSIASAAWGRFYSDDASDFVYSVEEVWKDLGGIEWLINSLLPTGANMMQPGIFLVPRSIIEKAGPWDESLSLIDDFEYMIRVLVQCSQVVFCEEAVLMYRSGNANTLSGQTSSKHMLSAFNSLNQGIQTILKVQNDPRSRQACANTYKRWSYLFYPEHEDLWNKMDIEIQNLGGSDIKMMGGKGLIALSRIIGWKSAKKMKLFLDGKS